MTIHKLELLAYVALLIVATGGCSLPPDTRGDENDSSSAFDAPGGSESSEDPVGSPPVSGECLPIGSISCGELVWGDTSDLNSGTTSVIDGYSNTVGNYSGPETAWSYHAETSGEVTWSLVDPRPMLVDHDLFVLSGAQGSCEADAVLARGFNSVAFDAVAGEDYFLVIDGYDGAQGAFEAELSCDHEFSDSTLDCPLADPDEPGLEPGSFYRCRDSQLNGGAGCGADGYPLAFAAKYAEIYMWEIYPDLGPEGRDFLDANLICLQGSFRADTTVEMSCAEVAEAGFAAHPPCYMSSGICDVPLSDQLSILLAVEWADLAHPSQVEAMAEIAEECFD